MKTWMFQRMGLLSPDPAPGSGDGGNTATATPAATPQSIFDPQQSKTPAIEATAPEKPAKVETPAQAAGTTIATNSPSAPTPAAAAPMVGMTDAQLQTLAQSLTAGAARAQPVPAPQDQNRPLTPQEQAEFDKEFHVVRITPEIFQSVLGFAPENPAQLKGLESLLHQVVRQANAMTTYKIQQQFQEREAALRSHLSPVLQAHQQQQATALESAMFTKHPDLKDFSGLLQEVALAEKARGTRFKSTDEAIDFVANKARTLLGNRANGGTTQTSTSTANTNAKPSMPTTSMGGRSGTNSSPMPASGPKAVFGDLDGSR